ncbi:MAG: fused MFS/spermidine synthase, partial [Acidobacteriota bacterium]
VLIIILGGGMGLRPGAAGNLPAPQHPIAGILAALARSIGIPYFILASTTPLIQSWYARRHDKALPYRLFALSNLASILGLLAYPVLIEPYLALRDQFQVWTWAYVALVGLYLAAALLSWRSSRGAGAPPAADSAGMETEPSWDLKLLWMLFAACACILLLAITNYLTQNIAPVPFLWVLPLGVYLLTFVICFNDDRSSNTNWWRWLAGPALAGLGLLLYTGRIGGLILTVSIFITALFVCCMFCHSELARRKPHSRFLTTFYLMVALGGALGGVFVGLIAPLAFNAYFELPAGMVLCALLALHVRRETTSGRHLGNLALVALAGFLVCMRVLSYTSGTRLMTRNFYGSLRVSDMAIPGPQQSIRLLFHGSVVHGVQFLLPQFQRQPTAYYGPGSGVALTIEASRRGGARVGVIGLGTGTLATYGRSGDYYRFYEINPLVIEVANTQFDFLRDSQAEVDVVLGDARVALEREPEQRFDVLVLDAFAGDSIPIHLLTREAFTTYFRHLKPDGLLAAHVSNQYLDIGSVVERMGLEFGQQAIVVESPGNIESRSLAAVWVLLASKRSVIEHPRLQAFVGRVALKPAADVWTDEYSNLLRVLK